VAHSNSAKKRIRQNETRKARNHWRKSQVKSAVRNFETVLKDGTEAQMQDALQQCYKTLDKVAAKGSIHKKTADRKKGRLAKAMNKALAKSH
jgi:small subunit ribosomal protein S20